MCARDRKGGRLRPSAARPERGERLRALAPPGPVRAAAALDAEGRRARARERLWDVERSALAAAEEGAPRRKTRCAASTRRRSRPARCLAAKGAASLAYLDACLAVDAPGERDPLTLTAFVRCATPPGPPPRRRKGRTARGRVKTEGPAGDAVRFQERSGTARGRRWRRARRRDGALARVRDRARRRAGGCRRRHASASFQREGNAHRRGPGDPDAVLERTPPWRRGTRAALAELRKWEGFPLDVRFARFRRAMRRARCASPSGSARSRGARGDARRRVRPEIEAELASARADRLAAEGRSRGAFAPGKALERSPVKVDVFRPSASSPTRAGVNGDSSPSARLPARKSPSAYRTPEKSPGAPRGRFGASGSKSGSRASPFSAAGERARRARRLSSRRRRPPPATAARRTTARALSVASMACRTAGAPSPVLEKLIAARRPKAAAARGNAAEANINETLSRATPNAENDLLRSSATMAAMDAARRARGRRPRPAPRARRAREPRRRTRRSWRRDAWWRNAKVKSSQSR